MKQQIEVSLGRIWAEIEAAKLEAGRSDEVLLLGVSKFQNLEKMKIAYEFGLRDFGENYVKEAIGKIQDFEQEGLKASFHFIGALQSNKAKDAVKYFDVIQSIDSTKLIDGICKALPVKSKTRQKILLQVNVSDEDQKSGVSIENCHELLSYALSKPEIEVLGLMMIGSFTDNLSVKKHEFRSLRELRDKLKSDLVCELPHLSMGMSEDFTLAIKEGATIVRIGSHLFGDRDKTI